MSAADPMQLTVLFRGRVQRVWLLDLPRVVVGRGRNANIALTGNDAVSRRHAVVQQSGPGHLLAELEAVNGTYVNGARVAGVIALIPGDEIQLGDHALVYDRASDEAVSLYGADDEDGETDEDPTTNLSRNALKQLNEEARVRRGPHLAMRVGEDIRLFPLATFKVTLGTGKEDIVLPVSGGWFGTALASIEEHDGMHHVAAASPMVAVKVNGSRAWRRTPLSDGDQLDVAGALLTYFRP